MRPLLRRKVRATPLVVEGGKVFCPVLHSDVALERCMTCPRLRRIAEDSRGSVTRLACQPVPPFFSGP